MLKVWADSFIDGADPSMGLPVDGRGLWRRTRLLYWHLFRGRKEGKNRGKLPAFISGRNPAV